MTVKTIDTIISYDYDPDVREYSIPYNHQNPTDVLCHYYAKNRPHFLFQKGYYTELTYGTDYTVNHGIATLLVEELPENSVLEFYRATVPLQPQDFPSKTLTRNYEIAIDRNTLLIQELLTWIKKLEDEIAKFERFILHLLKKFMKWVKSKLDDFEDRIAKVEDELENIHIADLPYVLQLAEYMTLLLRYAEEKLLTDLRYPISAYRERTRDKYGLDTAVLIVQRKQIIRVDDEGECDV